MKKYSYFIRIEGLNFDRFFNELKKQNIKIFNISRPNYKTCEFGLTFADYHKIKKQKLLKNFKTTILKTYNLGFLCNSFIKNVGLYLGGVVVAIFSIIICKTTLKINVLGTQNIKQEEIVNLLKQIDVKVGKINTVSNEDIEKYIKQNNDSVSLVSVVKKGTNLIVNIKEKIEKIEDVSPICAEYNMVIDSIVVSQGVAKVKSGDVVKKGDVLVEPKSVLTNGEVTLLKPIANIKATAWITGACEFKTEEDVFKRTGKKVVWSNYELNGKKLFSTTPQVKFENYDKIVYNNYVFKNFFLPLKLNRTIFYETKKETIKRNFEENKQSLIDKSKSIAYSKLPKGKQVLAEETIISQANNTYFVNTYLKIDVNI